MLLVILAAVAAVVMASPTSNFTVYRITPRNYTGLVNLDTGDAAGDAFFGLYEKSAPVVCRDSATAGHNLLCSNEPILQIPGFNVYTATLIEADDRFGDYAECNPDGGTGVFACGHHHYDRGPHQCWFNSSANPQWRTQFADFCNVSQCSCDAVETLSVGREFPKFGSSVPAGTPAQCAANYYVLPSMGVRNGLKPWRRFKAPALADCCSACTAHNEKKDYSCGLYSYRDNHCELFQHASFNDLTPEKGSDSGYFSGLGLAAFVQRAAGELSNLLNGTWFSTQAAGMCAEGDVPRGNGNCWWRVIEQTRNVNASCVNDNMIDTVVSLRPDCFGKCPHPQQQDSDCWIGCLFETLSGNTSAVPVIPPIAPQVIMRAFEKSFESSDPATGGCPEVAPCPEPCLPPCWAVPKGAPCTNNDE